MVVFALVLLVIILFYQRGLFGGREFVGRRARLDRPQAE